jgi:hypothetical protein
MHPLTLNSRLADQGQFKEACATGQRTFLYDPLRPTVFQEMPSFHFWFDIESGHQEC